MRTTSILPSALVSGLVLLSTQLAVSCSDDDAPRDAAIHDAAVHDAAVHDGAARDVTADAGAACVHPKVAQACVAGWCTIPSGCFTMGSPTTESCRESCWQSPCPQETPHEVTLTHSFEIQATEVTQLEFKTLRKYNPSWFHTCGDTCPVETLSWNEAAAYCDALSKQKGHASCYDCTGNQWTVVCKDAAAYGGSKIYTCPGYRLPTEAEWEYAYRAGTTTAFHSGEISACTGSDVKADAIGWYEGNSSKKTQPVGGKQANAWGLHDMSGNVWELCHDVYQIDLGAAAQTDPLGAAKEDYRANRGGSCFSGVKYLRAAAREANLPTYKEGNLGFRCVRTLKKK